MTSQTPEEKCTCLHTFELRGERQCKKHPEATEIEEMVEEIGNLLQTGEYDKAIAYLHQQLQKAQKELSQERTGFLDHIAKLEKTHQEELQKARYDWLREEIVKLENEKFVWLTPEEMKEHDGCRYKKGGLYVGQVAGDNFNGAIQIIQHRYHSELDQDVSK